MIKTRFYNIENLKEVNMSKNSKPVSYTHLGEIPGIWVGKFEATGEYTEGDASKVSVKPGVQSLRSMTVNDQYKAGMKATYLSLIHI